MKRVIVQVVQHLCPGGIETMALELQRCADPNDEVHIVSLEGTMKESIDAWPVLEERKQYLHFLNKGHGKSLMSLVSLVRLMARLKPDVVHTHHIGPLLYGGLAARISRVPVVIHTEHDAWHLRNDAARKIEKLAISVIRPIVVADARLVARALKDRVHNVKPLVIHNGIDVNRFTPGDAGEAREALGLPGDVKIIGCAARLEEVKGHSVLIEAIFRTPSNVHLALAGDGPLIDKLKAQVDDLGLAKRVHFLGRIDDMPTFYRAVDVFCLASKNEGMPLSPLEAQSCGTPVVLTDVGGCKEALCEYTGLLVEPGDARALSVALKRQLAEQFSVTPRAFVMKGKSISDMVGAYNRLAHDVLGS